MGVSWLRSGRPDLSVTLNGVLGGLVGITAGCATVDSWAAVAIGVVAGAIIVFGVEGLERLRIDDPVGAVPVHLLNGIWGTLAVGLFSSQQYLSEAFAETDSYGLLLGGGFDLLLLNLLGVIAIGVWDGRHVRAPVRPDQVHDRPARLPRGGRRAASTSASTAPSPTPSSRAGTTPSDSTSAPPALQTAAAGERAPIRGGALLSEPGDPEPGDRT